MADDNIYTLMLANGFRRTVHQQVTSTNQVCLQMAKVGDAGNLWVTAERQTEGKGSRGRSWVSGPGNLFASLLLIDPCQPHFLATLTFVASLAIRDAVGEIAQSPAQSQAAAIALKWPNDVLLNGKKISGILLESHRVEGKSAVIIGVGINIADFPANTLFPATSLAAENIAAETEQMFEVLARAMAKRLQQWNSGEDFHSIRKDWLGHAAGLGQPILAKIAVGSQLVTKTGIFEGLDDDGRLILLSPEGQREKLSLADIFFA